MIRTLFAYLDFSGSWDLLWLLSCWTLFGPKWGEETVSFVKKECHLQLQTNHKWKKKKRNVTQSCLTLCNPMDCSLPGSSVHGILQARILEWVAVSFSMKPTGGSITQLPCHSVEITLSFVQQFPKVPSGTESQSCTATNCWLTFLIASYHSWLTHHSPAPTRCYTFKWTTHLCPRGLLRESNIPGLYLSRKKGLPVCPAKILERKTL